MDIPECPENWIELWIGYSFIMVSIHLFNWHILDISVGTVPFLESKQIFASKR